MASTTLAASYVAERAKVAAEYWAKAKPGTEFPDPALNQKLAHRLWMLAECSVSYGHSSGITVTDEEWHVIMVD